MINAGGSQGQVMADPPGFRSSFGFGSSVGAKAKSSEVRVLLGLGLGLGSEEIGAESVSQEAW